MQTLKVFDFEGFAQSLRKEAQIILSFFIRIGAAVLVQPIEVRIQEFGDCSKLRLDEATVGHDLVVFLEALGFVLAEVDLFPAKLQVPRLRKLSIERVRLASLLVFR